MLFDLDGVLTSTAETHARCWKQMFDAYLRARADSRGEPFRPFDADVDYKRLVDGKPHYDGVRSCLASRGITLPEGSADSPPEEESVCGLANRKDALFERAITGGQVNAFPGSVAFARWIRELGLKSAVVSSSHHCAAVLRAGRWLCPGRGMIRHGVVLPPEFIRQVIWEAAAPELFEIW